jgi:carboxylesterase type B
MQLMAFGASKPLPFQQASCESQALEPGITGTFTLDAMTDVTNFVGCNTSDLQSPKTVECLRQLSTKELQHAQEATHADGPGQNIGDQWLPVVDGDFLPAAPSKLISEGRFGRVPVMIGWCEDDGNFFVGNPKTNRDVFSFYQHYLPAMTAANVRKLLSLYPVSDFASNAAAGLSAQVYRSGRILRDILFTCQPIHYGQAIANAGNNVYLWDQNQTMYDEILTSLGSPGYGVIHTSNFAYQFGNLSHYDVWGFPYHPNRSDFALRDRQSASWASFANFGHPSARGYDTLKGWKPAFSDGDNADVFVIGGPHEGLYSEEGPDSGPVFADQKLKERCAFINSPEIIQQLQY